MRFPRRGRRIPPDEAQLGLPLAWLGPDDFIRALADRGVSGLERIRFKRNRSRLISLSADHRSLNLHECFQGAPDRVIDAVASFLLAPDGSTEQRRAVHTMRVWTEGQAPHQDGPDRERASAGSHAQQQFLLDAYRALNRHLFGHRLPDAIPLRLSSRMARRFGHVEYRRHGKTYEISELALNVDLLIAGNERHLLDTLLHEMAHVEAWVLHGHRGHGAVWRRIAHRLGCEVRALSWVRIRRRRHGDAPHVPDLALLLDRARRKSRPGAWLEGLEDAAETGTAGSLAGRAG